MCALVIRKRHLLFSTLRYHDSTRLVRRALVSVKRVRRQICCPEGPRLIGGVISIRYAIPGGRPGIATQLSASELTLLS
jgi:hypothetical protein